MPCHDSRDEPENVRAETRREQQAYVDTLTRLLCEAMRTLEEVDLTGRTYLLSDDLGDWWDEHTGKSP